LARSTNFDAIWATSDPLTPLSLALEASRITGLPWVADIRDCLNVQRFGSWYKRPLFRRQERRLCRLADSVITVSEGLAEALHQITGRPISIISNGYDDSLLPAEKLPPSDLFSIVYAGTLVEGRQDPKPVFRALEKCINGGLIPKSRVEVVFLGTNPKSVQQEMNKVSSQVPVRVLPRMAHRAALAFQTQAAVLLVLAHAAERGVMTGKIFDYLATDRPILAVPDDSHTTSKLLKATRGGVALTDVDAIALQLAEWYKRWRSNPGFNLQRDEKEVSRYSRFEQAGELARILNGLVEAGPRAGRRVTPLVMGP
jgi:hypothetical protein